MLGVRTMEYHASKNGINNINTMQDYFAKEMIPLVRNEDVPDRIRRKDFVNAKSCIPEVTRFEVLNGDVPVAVYVYDENTDCMVKENACT